MPHDVNNRAEVPATFEMRMMMAITQKKRFALASLDLKTAFLNAKLCDAEDGIFLVR